MYCATCRKDISLPGSRRNLVSKGQTDFRNILSELFAFHPQEDAICRECAWKLTRVEKIEGEIGVKRVKLKHDFEVKCAKLNHEKTELIKKFELHLKENRNYTPIRRPPNKVHENDRSKPELINQGTQTELSEQYMDSYTPKFRKSPNKLQPIRPKRKPETPEQTPVSTKRVDVKPTPVKNAKRRPLFTSPRKPVARKPVAKVSWYCTRHLQMSLENKINIYFLKALHSYT